MNPVTAGAAGTSGHKLNRRSLAALLGTAVIAVAALGVTTAPASAKPRNACSDARARLALDRRMLDDAHAAGDQNLINALRSDVLDDQIAILENC